MIIAGLQIALTNPMKIDDVASSKANTAKSEGSI
jgi:hypothetical protein